jgi:nucleoid-associated protein YejK
MELGEQVGFGKGKCLLQAVEEFVRPRDFVKEEGDYVQEKVVT